MNIKQKKLVLTFLIVLVLSTIFVPTEMNLIVSGEGGFKPKTLFQGYEFIANVHYEIALKHLFVEWVTLGAVFIGLFFYFKED